MLLKIVSCIHRVHAYSFVTQPWVSIVTTAVFFAAQEGHFDALQYLHQKGKCDLGSRSFDGMSPIHAACQNGHLEIVQVSYYINDEIKIILDHSTLPVSLESQQPSTKLLKEAHHYILLLVSASVYQAMHGHYYTWLLVANGHEDIVRWLVNNDLTGTIAFIQDNNGDTPAHDAADNGYVSLHGS